MGAKDLLPCTQAKLVSVSDPFYSCSTFSLAFLRHRAFCKVCLYMYLHKHLCACVCPSKLTWGLYYKYSSFAWSSTMFTEIQTASLPVCATRDWVSHLFLLLSGESMSVEFIYAMTLIFFCFLPLAVPGILAQ